jgi:uncharacterized protein (TIGR00297 family)
VLIGFLAAAIGVVATLVLAALAVLGRALTRAAAAIAAAFGIVIVLLAGFPFLGLLVLFVGLSAAATRFRFEEKRRRGVQEGSSGERGISNVIAHIVIPTALAVTLAARLLIPSTVAVLYASALAFGASDTLASEFGVLSGKAWGILSRRPVPPGTNGGVSPVGTLFGLAGSALTALVALLLFVAFSAPVGSVPMFLLAVTAGGFFGCQVDSILGELFENRGVLSKGSVNFSGMLSATAIALGILAAAGAWS